MKKTILALTAGLLIGGATLGSLTASADELTLRQRVTQLEQKVDSLCLAVEYPASSTGFVC